MMPPVIIIIIYIWFKIPLYDPLCLTKLKFKISIKIYFTI